MQRIKELQSEGLYAIEINSSANSALVEKVYQAKKLLQLVNTRLSGFAKVYDYLVSNDSLFLVIQICESETVHKNYLNNRNSSNKANRTLDHKEIWRIISEQFRHLISMYVKWFNRDTGRSGSMVKKNYDRFYFEDVNEAEDYLSKMKRESIERNQKQKKYRPSKRVNSLLKRMKKGMIFLCGMHKELEALKESVGVGSLFLSDLKNDVLRKLVISTNKIQKQVKISKNSPADVFLTS